MPCVRGCSDQSTQVSRSGASLRFLSVWPYKVGNRPDGTNPVDFKASDTIARASKRLLAVCGCKKTLNLRRLGHRLLFIHCRRLAWPSSNALVLKQKVNRSDSPSRTRRAWLNSATSSTCIRHTPLATRYDSTSTPLQSQATGPHRYSEIFSLAKDLPHKAISPTRSCGREAEASPPRQAL